MLGEPAGTKVFTFESTPLEEVSAGGGVIYSQQGMQVWDHSLNLSVATQAATTRPNRFLTGGSILQGIIEVRCVLFYCVLCVIAYTPCFKALFEARNQTPTA